jgi:mannose-1-phosphate guanylyltransferase
MKPIHIDDVIEQFEQEDALTHEFLRRESMSLEIYGLEAGATDPQDPHTEDEVYYIISGSAKIQIGDNVHPVEPGDIIFVEREVEHYFFDIESKLITLVFFAPAFGSLDSE